MATREQYRAFIANLGSDEIMSRYYAGDRKGEGDAWGEHDETVNEAIEEMGGEILAHPDHDDTAVVLLSDRLYVVCDHNGPYAVEIADADEVDEWAEEHAPIKREYGAGRDAQVLLRVTEDERDAWDAAAERAGVSRSEWLRELANEAARRPRAADRS